MSDTDKGQVAEQLLEERIEELKKKIDAVLGDDLVKTASVVFIIDGENEPQACRKGHFYDVATMINYAMEAYKAKAVIDLGLKT